MGACFGRENPYDYSNAQNKSDIVTLHKKYFSDLDKEVKNYPFKLEEIKIELCHVHLALLDIFNNENSIISIEDIKLMLKNYTSSLIEISTDLKIQKGNEAKIIENYNNVMNFIIKNKQFAHVHVFNYIYFFTL